MPLWRFDYYQALTYPKYLDATTSCTLTAVPGESYAIVPAGSADLPVPPADGRWSEVEPPKPPVLPAPVTPAPAPAAPAAAPPAGE